MKPAAHIVVVGAGVAGLCAAALLVRGAFRVTVIDADRQPVFDRDDDIDLRVSAIAPGSVDVLSAAGAWECLDSERIAAFEHMRVWDQDDEPGGPATLRFDADEFALPALGYIVENRHLQHALLTALEQTDCDIRFETALSGLERDGNGYQLRLESGAALAADLVVAADGAGSRVRAALDIPVTKTAYAQDALVTHLQPERPHHNTAWQRFLRSGPLGILPLADGRVSVVWSTTPDEVDAAMAMTDEELGHALSRASDRVLGDLSVAGPRGRFPLTAQHAAHYVQHAVVLIGDAAHTLHPLAGQGANLGIADAAELTAVLNAAVDAGEHPGDRPVLRRYERARRGANASMQHFLTGLNRLFAADSALLGELRRLGMAAFNASGPIRRSAVQVAIGRR